MLLPLPPLRGETVTLAQKAYEILDAKGAKENFDKVPKLIYTVILWCRFVVCPHPPKGGVPARQKGGDFGGGGGGARLQW